MLKISNLYWYNLSKSGLPLRISISLFFFVYFFLYSLSLDSYFFIFLIKTIFFFSFILFFFNLHSWSTSLYFESFFQGKHNSFIKKNFRWGMTFFIISEVMFFFSFFWTYVWFAVEPSVFTAGPSWPINGVPDINAVGLPLINTIILLLSGVTVTWSHKCSARFDNRDKETVFELKKNNRFFCKIGLIFTLFLSFLFLINQIFEYCKLILEFGDSIYGSIFFLSTGFHFFHVLVGSFLLILIYIRLFFPLRSKEFHFVGFSLSVWYWHFVDIVWLALFAVIYYWGSRQDHSLLGFLKDVLKFYFGIKF